MIDHATLWLDIKCTTKLVLVKDVVAYHEFKINLDGNTKSWEKMEAKNS